MYLSDADCKIGNFTHLIDLLRYRAYKHPDRTAYNYLIGDGLEVKSLTYGELERKSRHLAVLLRDLGLTGERALLMYPAGLDFIIAFFACLYAGVIAVPAYPPRKNQSLDRLQSIVSDCDARDVLTTASVWQSLERGLENYPRLTSLRWLATDNLVHTFYRDDREFFAPDADTIAFLQYTSGSTGKPKGVMVSHGNIMANSRTIRDNFGHRGDEIVVSWLPQYHDMGLIGGILQSFYLGSATILMSPVDFLQKPCRWLENISRYGATTSGGPNFAYDLCVRKISDEQMENLDLSSWEIAFTGAEPIKASTLKAFSRKFAPYGFREEAFYPCYGMAEATLFISGGTREGKPVILDVDGESLSRGTIIGRERTSPGSKSLVGCGRTPDYNTIIVNPDTLKPCFPYEVGEIWVSGESVSRGYWNRPEETRETFRGKIRGNDEGEFLRTGDLGFISGDGELFVTGRLKDVIIVRGRNYYPQDLEYTAVNAHPSLKSDSTAAFSCELEGEEKLIIVQEVERSYLKGIDLNPVIHAIRRDINEQHGLQVYEVILIKPYTIPKTSSGKIQRFSCKNRFLDGTLEVIGCLKSNLSLERYYRDRFMKAV